MLYVLRLLAPNALLISLKLSSCYNAESACRYSMQIVVPPNCNHTCYVGCNHTCFAFSFSRHVHISHCVILCHRLEPSEMCFGSTFIKAVLCVCLGVRSTHSMLVPVQKQDSAGKGACPCLFTTNMHLQPCQHACIPVPLPVHSPVPVCVNICHTCR